MDFGWLSESDTSDDDSDDTGIWEDSVAPCDAPTSEGTIASEEALRLSKFMDTGTDTKVREVGPARVADGAGTRVYVDPQPVVEQNNPTKIYVHVGGYECACGKSVGPRPPLRKCPSCKSVFRPAKIKVLQRCAHITPSKPNPSTHRAPGAVTADTIGVTPEQEPHSSNVMNIMSDLAIKWGLNK